MSRGQVGGGVRSGLKRHEGEANDEGAREVVGVDEVSQDHVHRV